MQGEDWPVEVIGLDGVRKNVTMQPGQNLSLYESAKLVHGRPSVFSGTKYVNLFSHYEPVDESIWDYYHVYYVLHKRSAGTLADLKCKKLKVTFTELYVNRNDFNSHSTIGHHFLDQ